MTRLEGIGLALALVGLAAIADDVAGIARLLAGLAFGLGLAVLVDPRRA
ncbi:MAG: hypothetical protein HY317_03160 [Acidobacteria bacterium]|nr:hypothetical protein [Acidobacteriota bacterium]